MINHLSYEKTVKNLMAYEKRVANEICDKAKFPQIVTTQFISLRKNVELGFVSSVLTEWEYKNVVEYDKNHMYQEYYPMIADFVKEITLPRKAKDYGSNIIYDHLFRPAFYENRIYSFYVNFFEKMLFKNFNAHQSLLEQEVLHTISTFYRKQNKYGPEQISVAILDEQFVSIMISGLLTPFLQSFIKNNHKDAVFVEKIVTIQAKAMLDEILTQYFNEKAYNPYIHLDSDNDKMIILSSLSKSKWLQFFEKINT